MHRMESILVRARPAAVYRAAVAVARWPEILPHYRWVKVLEETPDGPVLEMAARRSIIPVRWVAVQKPEPENLRIYYRHVGGPTRGMDVVWLIEPVDGGTLVTIMHEMTLQAPLARTMLGRLVMAHGFIGPLARQTLAGLKAYLEADAAPGAMSE